eukprot:TRINITY_DN9364_c0_g1_i2.p1 TRINITY_DN9364_c0_g1~~TRINITY_DN9364_c0_g1_i2.p1  ORF type:complete len:299 (+),score=27.57 TRINITY_DN9364_c0_g1_i2:23-898(+)
MESDESVQMKVNEISLLDATSDQNFERVKELVEVVGVDVNCRHPRTDRTPLHRAAFRGNEDIVRYYLAKGAKVNYISKDMDGISPIYLAAQEGCVGAVSILIEAGAEIDKASADNGTTPLFMASQNGHHEVVKLLLQRGADPNIVTTDDETSPLQAAAMNGHLDIIKDLISEGANVNYGNTVGKTPLYLAVFKGYLGVVKLLLDFGADVDGKPCNRPPVRPSRTPLFFASVEILKTLLLHGANPLLQSSSNQTASMYVRSIGRDVAAEILEEAELKWIGECRNPRKKKRFH